jgi:hypothetical protein
MSSLFCCFYATKSVVNQQLSEPSVSCCFLATISAISVVFLQHQFPKVIADNQYTTSPAG